MKVAELIKKLSLMPQDARVMCSDDPELNGVHECFDPEVMGFDFRTCELGVLELTPELIEQGYSEEDVVENGTTVVIL